MNNLKKKDIFLAELTSPLLDTKVMRYEKHYEQKVKRMQHHRNTSA